MVLIKELKLSNISFDYSVKAFPTSPTTSHSHLAPLGKIPALSVLSPSNEVESTLFGSQVIGQYLDHLSGGGKALPSLESGKGGLERFDSLTTEALADGICEAALALRYERIERPKDLIWDDWTSGQLSKITRAIPMLSKRVTGIDPSIAVLPLHGIAAAISLYYVDRRAADSNWRELEGGQKLDEWYKKIQQRESWKSTPFVR
ncbi:glutathione S-transferase family protein [Sporobolomyces salmoneus]|uniref:glutathione S-transferase family protein n=1 Tax=Sporobolomyces salmoneus TaxID=183962 RepID=UPI003170E1BC